MDDIFMKIIRREIPAEIVYEDADTLAFLDMTPVNPGHTLVVPKKLVRNIFDADQETFGRIMETARKMAVLLRDSLGAEGVNITMNNEPAAGQAVFHLHVHVIPRYVNDGFKHWHGKPYRNDAAAAEVAEKIRAGLR